MQTCQFEAGECLSLSARKHKKNYFPHKQNHDGEAVWTMSKDTASCTSVCMGVCACMPACMHLCLHACVCVCACSVHALCLSVFVCLRVCMCEFVPTFVCSAVGTVQLYRSVTRWWAGVKYPGKKHYVTLEWHRGPNSVTEQPKYATLPLQSAVWCEWLDR